MRNWFVLGSMLLAAACGSDNKNPGPTVTCGAGTTLQGDMCVSSGSGNNTTCGAGTHLDGTTCVPDGGGTPGAPSISAITPNEAGATGYILFQITGTDLAGSDPTAVHVYFGDTTPSTAQDPNPCEAELGGIDGTTIAGEVPPMCSLSTAVTVTVVTDKGQATTGFHYDALFAVDGDPQITGASGDLYIIDPLAKLWFDLGTPADGTGNGFSYDAIAFDGTGALWATTTGFSEGDLDGVPQLVTIDLSTGVVTPVGELTDAGVTDGFYVSDMKWSGTTLYGWGYDYTAGTDSLVTIDSTTGVVTPLGTPTTSVFPFAGLAVDGGGVLWAAPGGASPDSFGTTPAFTASGLLTNVSTTDGTQTTVQTLDYGIGAPIDSLDFFQAYGQTALVGIVDNGYYGTASGTTTIVGEQLVFIDPTVASGSGNISALFELPAFNGSQSIISGIANAPATLSIARHMPKHTAWKPLAAAKPLVHR